MNAHVPLRPVRFRITVQPGAKVRVCGGPKHPGLVASVCNSDGPVIAELEEGWLVFMHPTRGIPCGLPLNIDPSKKDDRRGNTWQEAWDYDEIEFGILDGKRATVVDSWHQVNACLDSLCTEPQQ